MRVQEVVQASHMGEGALHFYITGAWVAHLNAVQRCAVLRFGVLTAI